MTEYILSVVGMILLSATVDMILPQGKMALFVRSIVAVFLFCTVVSPITKLTKSQDVISNIVESVDQQYVVDISSKQVSVAKERVQKSIKNNYGLNSSVEIEYTNENGVASFSKIDVTIENNENALNTNEIEAIKTTIKSICGQATEVNIYER